MELLQYRDGLAPAGYAAQKIFHCPRQETKLVHMRRGWRSTEEARSSLLIKGINVIIVIPLELAKEGMHQIYSS